jgi:hypothetical protein
MTGSPRPHRPRGSIGCAFQSRTKALVGVVQTRQSGRPFASQPGGGFDAVE